jgi:hypothetical protein
MTQEPVDHLGRDLGTFIEDHRACGALDTGFTGDPERVWMPCFCGARIMKEAAYER